MEEPTILFLEDIGTKPYKWDRLLQHMNFAGAMENVVGIVFGDAGANIDASDEREVLLLEDACLHALSWFRGPVATGLRCGHVKSGNVSLALGAEVELLCGADARLVMKGSV
jgi:muramoyltetrapeptide carboxypeptidase